ncbi:MAG TPA: hypothetical protein VGZ90_13570 [Puia sp.]|jgi:hypothetical protein|nr:hypothetical protein [Puia sp.]
MKKKSRRETILTILKNSNTELTCQEICKKIIKAEKLTGNVAHYLSGSISSKLAKLVKQGILRYADEEGIRGGHVYQLNNKYLNSRDL